MVVRGRDRATEKVARSYEADLDMDAMRSERAGWG